ncbi:MAG: hemolysin III family protein [Alphaproteobacteria bacterium]|nr:hemolysin III family protein [Alphaproteobacteria bacterium]
MKPVRTYSTFEHRADVVIHILGVLFAINASVWLLANVTGQQVVLSVTVYCLGLLAMTTCSAAYNMMPHHRPSKAVLRRIDHAAIFVMIAATYTPFAVNRLGPLAGDAILSAIWLCAMLGVTMKLLQPRRLERISVVLYLAMGWMIITVLKPLSAHMARLDFWLLIGGGLVYSLGVVFYLADRLPYHKAIWHGFVLAAAALQFSAIAAEFVR